MGEAVVAKPRWRLKNLDMIHLTYLSCDAVFQVHSNSLLSCADLLKKLYIFS